MIRVLLVIALTLCAAPLAAQTRPLTLDDLFDSRNHIDFSGDPPSGLRWISDTHYAWPQPNESEQVEWVKVDAATGATEPLFDAQKLRAAFDALPGLRATTWRRCHRSAGWKRTRRNGHPRVDR